MKKTLLAAMAVGLLTACGTTPQERTTGGAAAGAATGAGIGALGGPGGAVVGALVGGGAGAVTGAVTEPETVNLGEPPWSNPQARVPGVELGNRGGGATAASSDPRTRQLQQALNDRGYNAGPADGIYGPRTRSAVRDWQRANNMEATGTPNSRMLSELNVSSRGSATAGGSRMNGDRATGGSGGMTGSEAGGSGGLSRPNPTAPSAVAPSNNPMNDPVGGGSSVSPFRNNNQNTNEGGGGSGTR